MTIDCSRAGRASSRLVFGVGVMVVGLALTLDNFGLLDARRILRFWPLLLVAMGLVRLVQSIRLGGRPEGHAMALGGLALLFMNLGLVTFRQAIALFMLGVGAIIVWRAVLGRDSRLADALANATARLDAFAVLGGVHRQSRSQDFRGGNATAVLGGCQIDLRDAAIPDGMTAVFDTLALLGGVELRVPDDWSVESRGIALLGGFEDKTRHPLDDRKRLVVTGMTIMGGVEIKN